MAMQICLPAVITRAKSLQSLMPILNPHGLPQMKVMGLIGFWYWVNKQWGYCLGTRNYTIRSFPLTFSNQCFALTIGYGGTANDSFTATTGVTANIVSNSQFRTALYGSSGKEIMYWFASGV